MTKRPLYMIGGPTASGKTAAAVTLARRVDGVIINADAMQVYRGLPLLTAQPSPEEKAEIPHELFEVFDPSEKSSAGRWLALAKEAIGQATQAGRTPILVGGTGMYFAALLGGLADIPDIPDEVRVATLALYDEIGHDSFRTKLAALDPDSAARIAPNDRQRLVRAYEVAAHTGKTLGQWQKDGEASSIEITHEVHRQCLMPDRAELYARCDARFLKMIDSGALDEVRGLLERLQSLPRHSGDIFFSPQGERKCSPESDLVCDDKENKSDSASTSCCHKRHQDLCGMTVEGLPALKILGVPELASHLRGELSLDEAIAHAQQSTRNYAKRQCTWFRNQWGVE